MGTWSRGMILRLGRRGHGFKSRSPPFFFPLFIPLLNSKTVLKTNNEGIVFVLITRLHTAYV
jgi:hypothetical protein